MTIITFNTKREHDLALTYDEASGDSESFIARIFAELFGLGGSQVEFYYGDFARDVFWMQHNFDELLNGKVFYFGTRQTGTSIGFGRSEVHGWNSAAFECQVTQVDKSWGKKLVMTSFRLV